MFLIDKGEVQLYIDLNENDKSPMRRALKPTASTPGKRDLNTTSMYQRDSFEQLLVFRKLKDFSYFGEEDIIKKKARSFSAVCSTDCEFYTLDKIEMETIIKEEYPLLYEKYTAVVAEKGRRDFQNKKELLAIYKKFAAVDENKFENTLTDQSTKLMDDVPSLEDLYSEAIVFHPVEVLLNTFDSEINFEDDDPALVPGKKSKLR